MIKGLILDVDGVLVGGKKRYNWPLPNPQVIKTLKQLRENGMVVSLCTGKGTFAINEIVHLAHLDNIHIGDGGAIVIDIINNTIVEQHTIGIDKTIEVLTKLLARNIYTELYTQDGYHIQRDQVGDKTKKHKAILNKEPIISDSLLQKANELQVVKIMPVTNDEEQKKEIIELFNPYTDVLSLQWGTHPTALPYQFGIITSKGISKRQAAQTIAKKTGIPLEEMLGIGDGLTDWNFMELCGYAGAMGNASQELKDKVVTKGKRGYIGKSVDENGVLDILSYFWLC
jgi:HAD superfamily hydrolase (TIGR01484 family)